MTRLGLRRLAFGVAFAAAAYAVYSLPLADWLALAQAWSQANPIRGALLYLVFVIAGTLLLTPGWVLMMSGGLFFGVVPGLLYALAGISLGALAAFHAGRGLARPWVENRIRDNPRMLALDTALDQQAFRIVILTRLALLLPFNLLNYAYGLTGVSQRDYALATTIGMLPATTMYVYLGTLAEDIGEILSGDATPDVATWWIAGIALVAIVAVVWIVQRAAGRALRESTSS